MRNLIIRLAINAAALWVAATIVEGIQLTGTLMEILIVAVIFGLVNALIKPVVKFFAFPLILLTLGLLTVVINALMLMLTAGLTPFLSVSSFGPAFVGSVIVSVVSMLLGSMFDDDDEQE